MKNGLERHDASALEASPSLAGPRGLTARLKDMAAGNADAVRAYLSMISGSGLRLVISLAYFIAVANTLSIADFGLFATASACGIMLSRLLAFGFVSPLYRVATVKRRLLGAYTAGFLGGIFASLPLISLAGLIVHQLVFAGEMAFSTFAILLVAEVLCWRIMEIVVIVSYGINRFAAGSALVVIATAIKALAALAFAFSGHTALVQWSWFYLGANAASALIAVIFFYPRVRLRWTPKLYLRRWVDAVSVAGSEILFYVQSELDKVLVLALGGPVIAGIYAMIMRLVDLTALPVRSFFTILTQRLMRTPALIDRLRVRIGLELAVASVSTVGLLAMAGFLHVFPGALGPNVAEAVPILILVAMVPALRNLLEYHSELLYATGRTVVRTIILAGLGLAKAIMLSAILTTYTDVSFWALLLNGLFLVLYLMSALLTYRALARPAQKPI